jgi:hypothetical protein
MSSLKRIWLGSLKKKTLSSKPSLNSSKTCMRLSDLIVICIQRTYLRLRMKSLNLSVNSRLRPTKLTNWRMKFCKKTWVLPKLCIKKHNLLSLVTSRRQRSTIWKLIFRHWELAIILSHKILKLFNTQLLRPKSKMKPRKSLALKSQMKETSLALNWFAVMMSWLYFMKRLRFSKQLTRKVSNSMQSA